MKPILKPERNPKTANDKFFGLLVFFGPDLSLKIAIYQKLAIFRSDSDQLRKYLRRKSSSEQTARQSGKKSYSQTASFFSGFSHRQHQLPVPGPGPE
ncbi:MAG: hypothetical protein NC124_03500 [Clostridium sp.]|nr:hypothetical protein [Clostridium sp.]